MSIINTIKERKSVRSYTGESLSSDLTNKIKNYISNLSSPFDSNTRIELVSSDIEEHPIKLGTYGFISGANHFLVLIVKDKPKAAIGAGYVFEQAILYCTESALGTCWLGGTFNRKDFLSQIELRENEKIAIISPVGYQLEKKRLLDSLIQLSVGSDKRKAFEHLFFNNTFENPLARIGAGDYETPLDMVRLAPSASNKQPWRIVKEYNKFHFYHRPNKFSLFDIGIALCHFELTCKELKLKGSFNIDNPAIIGKDLEYVMTWIGE